MDQILLRIIIIIIHYELLIIIIIIIITLKFLTTSTDFRLKLTWRLTKAKAEMKSDTEQIDGIEVAIESWL